MRILKLQQTKKNCLEISLSIYKIAYYTNIVLLITSSLETTTYINSTFAFIEYSFDFSLLLLIDIKNLINNY